METIKELLNTGLATAGSLLIVKKIHDTLIDEVDKVLIPRSEAAYYFGPAQIPGSSIDIDLTDPNTGDIRVVAEGAEVPIDQATYASTNIKPVKYGMAIRITREMLEDAKWNLLDHNIKVAGKRFAEKETELVITQLDSAGNTVSGGAAATIANITRAMQYLDDNDYTGTTILMGNEFLNDLRNIDTFVEADKAGNREMLSTGFVGNIYGLNVLKFSTKAAPSSTYSKYAYVYDKNQAYALAEKRPITIERFQLPSCDMSAAAITWRFAAKIIRSNAVAKITTA